MSISLSRWESRPHWASEARETRPADAGRFRRTYGFSSAGDGRPRQILRSPPRRAVDEASSSAPGRGRDLTAASPKLDPARTNLG